jgi:hypothetical protein
MLTTMTEEDWTIVLRHLAHGAATTDGTTGSFSKPCSISWFTTSLGETLLGLIHRLRERRHPRKPMPSRSAHSRTRR